ncbi:MAG: FAD-dependent oxidoreductase [Gallionellaceae bacterium]
MTAISLRVAVLGAGIMGSSTALLLARSGVAVELFDAASGPCSAASRWNEGKIHLGYLYSADPSLDTARRIIPGGLVFKPMLENLIGCSLDSVTTPDDDIYLCHRNSIIQPGAMQEYFMQVSRLVRQHPAAAQYLADASDGRVTRMTARELAAIADSPDIIAGFRVPERSVSTTFVADRLVDALMAEAGIAQRMNTRITLVRPHMPGTMDGGWIVESSSQSHGPYDHIVNCLWEGRIAIDQTAGVPPPATWSNRFRLSLFLRTTRPVHLPSATVGTGAFGDMKNYNNRDFYFSWYPMGLMLDSSTLAPPDPPALDESTRQEISGAILKRLGEFLPQTVSLHDRIEHMELRGGWVHAAGRGQISDPASTLHRRTDFGISRKGSYISVDTGKYSTAPWLAEKVVDSILSR